MTELKDVAVANCVADPEFNTRTDLGQLEGLIKSIQEHGIEVPLLGRMKDDGQTVEIYAGFRRFAAAQKLDLKKIPVMVSPRRSLTKQMMLVVNLAENLHREDLNPVDEARGFARLQGEHNLSVEEIAQKMGLKKAYIQARFRLLKLDDNVLLAVQQGIITQQAAFEIDRLPRDKQLKFVAIAAELSGVKLRILVDKEIDKIQRRIEGAGAEPATPTEPVPAADVTEHIREIKKFVPYLASACNYDAAQADDLKAVNFRALEPDHLKTTVRLFGDLCDVLPEKLEVNEKGAQELSTIVAAWSERPTETTRPLNPRSPSVQHCILEGVRARAQDIAEERRAEGKRAKITFAILEEAMNEFFPTNP